MGVYIDQVPDHIRDHVIKIARTSGIDNADEAVELIARAWLEKKALFEESIEESRMEEWDEFPSDEVRGAIVLTYSGSLLTVGPLLDGKRGVEYASIGLRKDVPESAVSADSVLLKDMRIDDPAVFSGGPVSKSSAVYKIAVSVDKLEPEAEKELLSDVTQALTQGFLEVNKTVSVS